MRTQFAALRYRHNDMIVGRMLGMQQSDTFVAAAAAFDVPSRR